MSMNESILFHVTAEEKAVFRDAAWASRLSLSEWVRIKLREAAFQDAEARRAPVATESEMMAMKWIRGTDEPVAAPSGAGEQ